MAWSTTGEPPRERRIAIDERCEVVLELEPLALARLFQLLHDARGLRIDACRTQVRDAGWR